jgi:hypothetical protein
MSWNGLGPNPTVPCNSTLPVDYRLLTLPPVHAHHGLLGQDLDLLAIYSAFVRQVVSVASRFGCQRKMTTVLLCSGRRCSIIQNMMCMTHARCTLRRECEVL